MSIILTKKGNKEIATIDKFTISGGVYLANTSMTPSNTYWVLPVHSSALLRVIIMANITNQSSGYLFGDSVFNIKLENGNITWNFDGKSYTQSVTEGIHYLGFIDGKPALDGNLLSDSSITATISSDSCYLASANLSDATPLSNTKIIKVEVYGHSSTSSDIVSFWSFYGVRQSGTNAGYLAEKWTTTIIERAPQGSCTAQSGADNDVQWGISIDDLRQVINTPHKDLVAIVARDNDMGVTGDTYDAIKDANGEVVYKSAFCLKDTPLPSGHTRVDNALYPSLERGDLIPARTPMWNLWSDGFSFGKFFRPNYASADAADTITYYHNGVGGSKNVKDNQRGHLSINFLYDGDGVRHSDGLVHLEDFAGYRYGEYHKPAIYLDGIEVNDFNEIVYDENGGTSIQPRKLLTTMFGGYPVGGGDIAPHQMHTIDGYPCYTTNKSGYTDTILFVAYEDLVPGYEGYHIYYYEIVNGDYVLSVATDVYDDDLIPRYYEDENGVPSEKIKHTPKFISSNTEEVDITNGTSYNVISGYNDVIKYIPPSGFDFRFRIGNLVNWHKANTYLDANGTPLQLKGAYFALRLVDTIDTDLTTDVNEAFGIPLMLGYRLDSNILGSSTSEALKNELIETGVVVEDIWNKLPPSFTQAIKVYALRNARYTCYGEIGLLGNGFSGTDAQLANFSNYAYTARRLFKQMTANLYMDSYDGTQFIIKGFDKTYNGKPIRIIGKPTISGTPDSMMLQRNKCITLGLAVLDENNDVISNVTISAKLSIYREVRDYEILSGIGSPFPFYNILGITNYKTEPLSKSSITLNQLNGVAYDFVQRCRGNSDDNNYAHFYSVDGVDICNIGDNHLFDPVYNQYANKYIYLTWSASEFSGNTDIVKEVTSKSNGDVYKYAFLDNCTFVIEITGIESKN